MNKKNANRLNAAKSTGPRSEAGKRNVKLNALKHGFHAAELIIPAGAETEFELLRDGLFAQLAPATALQQVAFDNVLRCSWRCTLAHRAEMLRLSSYLKMTDELEASVAAADDKAVMGRWYACDRATLREGRRLLSQLRQDVQQHGWIHGEQWKETLIKGFGIEFHNLLSNWAPMSVSAIRLAEMLTEHGKRFKPLPESEEAANDKRIVDPRLTWQMMIKLIDLQDQHLASLATIYDRGSGAPSEAQAGHCLDLNSRYYTAAMRDMHRAVEWYRGLKKNNL